VTFSIAQVRKVLVKWRNINVYRVFVWVLRNKLYLDLVFLSTIPPICKHRTVAIRHINRCMSCTMLTQAYEANQHPDNTWTDQFIWESKSRKETIKCRLAEYDESTANKTQATTQWAAYRRNRRTARAHNSTTTATAHIVVNTTEYNESSTRQWHAYLGFYLVHSMLETVLWMTDYIVYIV